MIMKNKYIQQTLSVMIVIMISISGVAGAIDLSYNPHFDAPKSTYAEPTLIPKKPVMIINYLPEKGVNNEKENSSFEKGWSVKAPTISLDKTPFITDKREAVKISEEQRWLNEEGKNYDENPLNSDNYRITVEAEYSF